MIFALGVSPAAHVYRQKRIAVRRKIHASIVIALAYIGRQGEQAGARILLAGGPIHGGVQVNAVAQRDFDAPLPIDFGSLGKGGRIGCHDPVGECSQHCDGEDQSWQAPASVENSQRHLHDGVRGRILPRATS